MFKLIPVLLVYGVVELTLLLVLADYASWEVALLEIAATGLLGAAVIRYVTSHFGQRILARMVESRFPGDVLVDGAILFIAGVLLVLPGVLGDVVGLLLLIPPVRWLVMAWLQRWHKKRFDAFQARFVHSQQFDNPDAGAVILDGRVQDDHSLCDD